MGKSVRAVLIAIIVSLVFIGGIHAQQKGGSRVIYEESTTFKDAKHRALVLSEIEAQSPQSGDKPQQKQLPADALMEKILPIIEKFLGEDAAALINEYRKGRTDEQDAGFDEQTDKGKFRESPKEHQWKGLRRTGTGDKAQ